MKRLIILLAAALTMTAAFNSCSQYDDTELRNSLTDLEERIADLEEVVRTEQDRINAINELIKQIESGVTVDDIEETADGYDIILSNGERISISNGNDGTATEALSLIVKEEDGVWYWAYSDGTFVTIDGERIPVTTEAPQVRINEETGNWEINNGDGWEDTGIRARAEDGIDRESFLEGITEDDDYYYITLKGGNVVTLPKTTELSFRFESDEELLYFKNGETREISYTMTGNVTVMTVNKPDGWRTTVDEENSVMSITAPTEDNLFAETAGVISVVLTDAQGKNFAALLNVSLYGSEPFVNVITRTLTIPQEGGDCTIEIEIINPVEGGTVSVSQAPEWISNISCTEESVTFTAAQNDSYDRSADIVISYSYNGMFAENTAVISQEGSINFDYDRTMYIFQKTDFGGGNYTISLYSEDYYFSYVFDLYCEPQENGLPVAGTYTWSETSGLMIFLSYYSFVNENRISTDFTGGTVDVSYEGENIVIEAIVTDENGLLHHVTYNGPTSSY